MAFRREKEKVTAPEQPKGSIPMFVYRTASGRLLASPSAALTYKGHRTSQGFFLSGNGVRELDPDLSEKLDDLIKPDSTIGTVSSRKWYTIPESGVFKRKVVYVSGNDGGEQMFRVDQVPQPQGLYAIFSDYDYYDDPSKIANTQIYPASYRLGEDQQRVALSLYDVTKWLEAKESQYGGRLFTRRHESVDEDKQKEVWYEAKLLYERLKDSGLIWLTPAQLEGGVISESNELSTPDDPVDILLTEAGGDIALGAAMPELADLKFNTTESRSMPIDLSKAKSLEELKRLIEIIQSQIPSGGIKTLARLRLSDITEQLDEDLPAEERLRVEKELREFASNQGLTIPEASVKGPALSESQVARVPVRETVPMRIRMDEYRDLLKAEILTLQVIVEQEKNKDIGRWRLAVAALATKGYEGQLVLVKLKLDKDARQAIVKGLQKAVTEARTNRRTDIEQIEQEVSEATQALDRLSYLETAQRHPLLDEYLGSDQSAREKFAATFYTKLLQEAQEWGQLPPEDSLDKLIEQVIEEM